MWRQHTDHLLDWKSHDSMTETETEEMSLPKIPDSVFTKPKPGCSTSVKSPTTLGGGGGGGGGISTKKVPL